MIAEVRQSVPGQTWFLMSHGSRRCDGAGLRRKPLSARALSAELIALNDTLRGCHDYSGFCAGRFIFESVVCSSVPKFYLEGVFNELT